MSSFTLTLTEKQGQLILNGLQTQAFKDADPLIKYIIQNYNAQTQPQSQSGDTVDAPREKTSGETSETDTPATSLE